MMIAKAGNGIVNLSIDSKYAGTLGGPVWDRFAEPVILTCFHCIYANGFDWRSRTVSSMNPYASVDSGDGFEKFGIIQDVLRNEYVDIAIVKPMHGNLIDFDLAGWGQATGIRRLDDGEKNDVWLKKIGFRSEVTYGLFTGFQTSFGDYYDELSMFYLNDLIKIESQTPQPFATVGDSGSFVLDSDNRVVGIVVMGEGSTSYAIKAEYIENHFKVKFQLL